MKKIFLIMLGILFLLVPMIFAQELEISIHPHYFSKGYEVTYTPDIEISGIKFEIIGKNNNQTSRLLNLQILESNINFPNETKELRILQTKSLFMSGLINVNQSNSTYFVKVFGINEKSNEVVYANNTITLNIEYKEPQNIFLTIGEKIFPSNPTQGIIVGMIFVVTTGFLLWKYEIKSYVDRKTNEWKSKDKQKRQESYNSEEGW